MSVPFIPRPAPRPPSGGAPPPINLPHRKQPAQKPAPKTPPVTKNFTRPKFRKELEKVENTWDIKMKKEERKEKEKGFLWKYYGDDISQKDVEHRIKKLKEAKFKAKTYQGKLDIEHEISLIRKASGNKKK